MKGIQHEETERTEKTDLKAPFFPGEHRMHLLFEKASVLTERIIGAAIEVHPERHNHHVAPPGRASGPTPLQREHARTIFQKGAPGRRAFTCPGLDVPALPADALPEHLRRAQPPRLPEAGAAASADAD